MLNYLSEYGPTWATQGMQEVHSGEDLNQGFQKL